ncbi:zinc finger [Umbelopsis nana]
MASNSGFYGSNTGKDTTFRRTWNKEEYAAKAKEREQADKLAEENEERKAKGLKPKHRPSGPAQPQRELLKAREEKVVLDANLNRTQVVSVGAAGPASKQPGFYCKACDCVVKDSTNYLDHINGKKHQRNLGMSMRVERASLDNVKERLAALKRKKEQPKEDYDLDARIEARQREEEEAKRRKKEKKKAKKEAESEKPQNLDGEAAVEEDDMAKMMGFAGFGSTKA